MVLKPLWRTVRYSTADRQCAANANVSSGKSMTTSHPLMDFWTAYQSQTGPLDLWAPYKQETLYDVTHIKISHCTEKWQKVLLANWRNDLNIHFEAVTRKEPSRHLQRECLSPPVFCEMLGLALHTDIMQYWSSESAGRNQGSDHTVAVEGGILGIPAQRPKG